MRRSHLAFMFIAVVSTASAVVFAQTRPAAGPVVYDGARLIIGDTTPPIESGTIVVESGRITAIGAKGSVRIPSGAARVDLTGKTVMPALINAHVHF